MIWLVNLVSALLQICCLLSMAAFFINILLFTYVDYNLHILVVCRGGHISYFIWSNIRYVTDDITIVKTLPPPPFLVCFSLLSKQLTFFTQICVMFLIVQARSPILHNLNRWYSCKPAKMALYLQLWKEIYCHYENHITFQKSCINNHWFFEY